MLLSLLTDYILEELTEFMQTALNLEWILTFHLFLNFISGGDIKGNYISKQFFTLLWTILLIFINHLSKESILEIRRIPQ